VLSGSCERGNVEPEDGVIFPCCSASKGNRGHDNGRWDDRDTKDKTKMTAASKPIRYELTIKDGTIYSLIYRTEGKPIVIKACQLINGTSLPKADSG
jgi:hypothetical protein